MAVCFPCFEIFDVTSGLTHCNVYAVNWFQNVFLGVWCCGRQGRVMLCAPVRFLSFFVILIFAFSDEKH